MKHIIKAQLYQLRKSQIIYIVFLLLLFMECTIMFGESDFMVTMGRATESLIVTGDYIANNGAEMVSVAIIFALIFTAEVCGADFIDKTTNYELMSGHERKDVYFGRAVLSIIGGTIGTMLIIAFPIIVGCIAGEWGDSIAFGDVLLRYLLSVFPVIRMVCEFVFLTYLVKNAYIVMAAGVFVGLYGPVIYAVALDGTASFLGLTSLAKLYDYESTAWSTFTLVGEKTITIYDGALSASEIVPVILASVIIGGIFLIIGYWYYKKDDLN